MSDGEKKVDPPPYSEPSPAANYPPSSQVPPPYPQPHPQPQGYSQHAANTTVIVHQPQGIPQGMPIHGATCRYGQYPALIVCQHCMATVTTSMTYETGLLTWAIAGGLCIFGLWLGCCLIPFCIDGTKDIEHRCPNCNNVVGKFRHFGN